MSSKPNDAAAMQSSGGKPRWSLRAVAVAGALIAAAIAVVLVLVYVVHGSSSPAPAASSAMTTSGGSMAGMSSPSGMPMSSGSMHGVMTVRAASLPAMTGSSSGPMAMAIVPIGNAMWDGMRIEARTSAPATFALFNGTAQQMVRPTAKDSFHLMVALADASTNYAIPYSSVWATIRKAGKIVFDERLWPMISRYMGPHYGNNVSLPSAGLYRLTLLVSPPVAARHLEYKGLWLKPHRVTMSFNWVPRT